MGCQRCQSGRLCDDGSDLVNDLAQALASGCGSTASGLGKAQLAHARAEWLAHCWGTWEDEPAPLSKNERALLRAFVNRRRPDIPARRAGMHQR